MWTEDLNGRSAAWAQLFSYTVPHLPITYFTFFFRNYCMMGLKKRGVLVLHIYCFCRHKFSFFFMLKFFAFQTSACEWILFVWGVYRNIFHKNEQVILLTTSFQKLYCMMGLKGAYSSVLILHIVFADTTLHIFKGRSRIQFWEIL